MEKWFYLVPVITKDRGWRVNAVIKQKHVLIFYYIYLNPIERLEFDIIFVFAACLNVC